MGVEYFANIQYIVRVRVAGRRDFGSSRMKSKRAGTVAIFPGTFDPPTNGHLDIIRRGRTLFDTLIVALGQNPEKEAFFSTSERLAMLRQLLADLKNVRVDSYDGLTMDYAKTCGARAVLRGIRNGSDLQYELQQANVNLMVGGVETVFLLASDEHVLTSSTLIRQVVELGGHDRQRLLRLVPPLVASKLRKGLDRRTRPQASEK